MLEGQFLGFSLEFQSINLVTIITICSKLLKDHKETEHAVFIMRPKKKYVLLVTWSKKPGKGKADFLYFHK